MQVVSPTHCLRTPRFGNHLGSAFFAERRRVPHAASRSPGCERAHPAYHATLRSGKLVPSPIRPTVLSIRGELLSAGCSVPGATVVQDQTMSLTAPF